MSSRILPLLAARAPWVHAGLAALALRRLLVQLAGSGLLALLGCGSSSPRSWILNRRANLCTTLPPTRHHLGDQRSFGDRATSSTPRLASSPQNASVGPQHFVGRSSYRRRSCRIGYDLCTLCYDLRALVYDFFTLGYGSCTLAATTRAPSATTCAPSATSCAPSAMVSTLSALACALRSYDSCTLGYKLRILDYEVCAPGHDSFTLGHDRRASATTTCAPAASARAPRQPRPMRLINSNLLPASRLPPLGPPREHPHGECSSGQRLIQVPPITIAAAALVDNFRTLGYDSRIFSCDSVPSATVRAPSQARLARLRLHLARPRLHVVHPRLHLVHPRLRLVHLGSPDSCTRGYDPCTLAATTRAPHRLRPAPPLIAAVAHEHPPGSYGHAQLVLGHAPACLAGLALPHLRHCSGPELDSCHAHFVVYSSFMMDFAGVHLFLFLLRGPRRYLVSSYL